MSKLILTGLIAAAALGVAGCDNAAENNVATTNLEDFNTTEDLNMDMNMDVNATDNAVDNAVDNAIDNAADNATTNNSSGY